jgi:hypothetical protein
MSRALAQALERCNRLAKGIEERDYNNYNLANAKDNNPVLAGNLTPKRRLNYNDYNALKERIHSDELYLLAQSWGFYYKDLCKVCVECTETVVRQSILKVRNIQDRFFRDSEPIAPQRGRYLRKVIREEAK